MIGLVDLHTHSTASDGSMTPKQLVLNAKENNVSVLSLTDHDTIDGIEEANQTACDVGIQFIPGIEIGVEFKTEMHILGYFNMSNYKNISSILNKLLESREERNKRLFLKLKSIGMPLTEGDVLEEAGSKLISKLHFARALVKKSYVPNVEKAFKEVLAFGKCGFVQKDKISPEEGINAILKAGGVPILAHPALLEIGMQEIEDVICNRLIKAGIGGIEVYYPENSVEETNKFLEICLKNNILPTGGSDFHGKYKQWINIGVGRGNLNIGFEVAQKLLEKINAK